MKTNIEIDGIRHQTTGGWASARAIYELAGCQAGRLFLKRPGDMGIPLDPTDFLVIQGGETFVTGKIPATKDPSSRNAVRLRFNGKENLEIPGAKITGGELKTFDTEHPQGRLFADIGTGPDIEIADETIILLQEGNAFFVIPASDGSGVGSPVDIEDCGRHDRPPPKGHRYIIMIDREKHTIEKEKITGAQILSLVGKDSEGWALNRKLNGGKRERIMAENHVDVTEPGTERFETVRRQAQQGRGSPS